MQKPGIDQQPDACEPLGLYPIRVVAAQTGIGVHTLRAWERRYGLPCPTRTAGEHRLYRMEDIHLLRRVQALIAHGTPPSRACALTLAERDGNMADGDLDPAPVAAIPSADPSSSPALGLRTRLRAAALALDEAAATSALGEAFTLFGAELALERVILPTLAEIGAAWAEGHASVAAEHFTSMLVRARLLAAFDCAACNERAPVVLLGAGPGDQHEIPIMALALLLRRRGWRSIYLGPDTPLEALRDAIARTRPRMVCLSATLRENLQQLIRVLHALQGLPECDGVILTYGGAPFRDDPVRRQPLEGIATYLGDNLRRAAARAHHLLLGEPAPDGDE